MGAFPARGALAAALLVGATTTFPYSDLRAQGTSEQTDLQYYQSGMIPISIALADDLPYPGTDAVLIRRRAKVPHDLIVIRSTAASEGLLARALFTLYATQSKDSACPSRDGVFRVTDRSGTRPPIWTDQDQASVGRILSRVRGRAPEELPGVGRAKVKRIWVRRFWNEPRERYPFDGGPKSVC
jgi:hypothetical protein